MEINEKQKNLRKSVGPENEPESKGGVGEGKSQKQKYRMLTIFGRE